MRFRFSVLALSLLCMLDASGQLMPASAKNLTINTFDGRQLNMLLFQQTAKSPSPLLIICFDAKDSALPQPIYQIAHAISAKMPVLIVKNVSSKKVTNKDSSIKIFEEPALLQNRVTDHLAALTYLRNKAPWWNDSIYCVGISTEGIAAGLLASFYPKTLGITLLNTGGGLTPGEALSLSTGLQLQEEGKNKSEIFGVQNKLKDSLRIADFHPQLKRQIKDHSYAWWASIQHVRLLNVLIHVRFPVYFVFGSNDIYNTPLSYEKVIEDFKTEKKKNLFVNRLVGIDHNFNDTLGNTQFEKILRQTITELLGQPL